MKNKLKDMILSGQYTCVAMNPKTNEIIYTSNENVGVKPIITPMRENRSFFKDLYIADTTIGKAAAALFALSGIKYAYAKVMSKSAIEIFKRYNILYEYDIIVDYIENRTKTGMCPLEECLKNENDISKAWDKIENKIAELMNN